MHYPQGLDPYTARQHLLHNTYSPLISITASYNSEVTFQSILKSNDDVSVLSIFKSYGNNAKYPIPNQSFKITNNQLITKNYPSFPIRFEPSLPDLLSIFTASSSTNPVRSSSNPRSSSDASSSPPIPNKLRQLFSISSLEMLLQHVSASSSSSSSSSQVLPRDLYLKFFNKIITSNNIVPFETFNHPTAQVFVIDYAADSIDTLRKMIVDFRNTNFPPYFQIDDLLIHVFIMYDSSEVPDADIYNFQNLIKKNLTVNSTSFPIIISSQNPPADYFTIPRNETSTIEEDLQAISLNQNSKTSSHDSFQIPRTLDSVLRAKIHEFINKALIPHMQRKVRLWDDQILAPKKSFTGRIFSVSRKFFNNNANDSSNNTNSSGPHSSTFNYQENYYSKSSVEQTIRKLADWSLILKDFKYAYSTYDFIKKDYTNDKAWCYVASTQEMCIVSLLLAQTQQAQQQQAQASSSLSSSPSPPVAPDKNTLRKIRHDIIEPYIDNLSYTFKSRLNVKTYAIKTFLVVVELLLCMCLTYNISYWWNDLIEKYLCKCISEFDTHLIANNQSASQVIRAILYERLGYTFGKCVYLTNEDLRVIDLSRMLQPPLKTPSKEKGKGDDTANDGLYRNANKLGPDRDNAIKGLTRLRKSSIWYLLSMKEWLVLQNYNQIKYSLENVGLTFDTGELTGEWYDRHDLLLGFIKKSLSEHEAARIDEPVSS